MIPSLHHTQITKRLYGDLRRLICRGTDHVTQHITRKEAKGGLARYQCILFFTLNIDKHGEAANKQGISLLLAIRRPLE